MAYSENWYIQMIIQTTDYTGPGRGFIDASNEAGIREGASREYDTHDARELLPPDPNYIILFFPHFNPEAPDYWPPPNDDIYAFDFRPPGFEEETWHIDVFSQRMESTECYLWWQEIEEVPPEYGLYLINLSTSDTVNMRSEDTITVTIPHGTRKFALIVKDEINSHLKIIPRVTHTTVGERVFLTAYLYEFDSDSFEVDCSWEATDPCGIVEDPGQFYAIASGTNSIIANYFGMADTLEILIDGEGDIFYLDLQQGWNMFSLPVIPPDLEINHCLPYFEEVVFEYNSDSMRYYSVDTLDITVGFFGMAQNDTSLLVVGIPFYSFEKSLDAGWHLMGAISDTLSITTGLYSIPEEAVLANFFGFNSLTRRYNQIYNLYPGNAFWAFMRINGRLHIGE